MNDRLNKKQAGLYGQVLGLLCEKWGKTRQGGVCKLSAEDVVRECNVTAKSAEAALDSVVRLTRQIRKLEKEIELKQSGRKKPEEKASTAAEVFRLLAIMYFDDEEQAKELRKTDITTNLGGASNTAGETINDVVSLPQLVRPTTDGIEVRAASYYQKMLRENRPLKDDIAETVAELIEPGTSIACTEGSTVALCVRKVFSKGKHVSLVTNNIGIMEQGLADVEIELIGGTYFAPTHASTGHEAAEAFRQYQCRTALMGVSGLDEAGNLYVNHASDCRIRTAVLNSTTEDLVIVADATKLGRTDRWHFASIPDCAKRLSVTLVTNDLHIVREKNVTEQAEQVLQKLMENDKLKIVPKPDEVRNTYRTQAQNRTRRSRR